MLRALIGALLVLAVIAGVVGGVIWWRTKSSAQDDRRQAAASFVTAWEKGDRHGMWEALTPAAQARAPEVDFAASYRRAYRAAGVRELRAGTPGDEANGHIAVPVVVTTADFGELRGTVQVPVKGSKKDAGVEWDPMLRLPGLRAGEAVHKRSGTPVSRGEIIAADGTLLDATALGASIAGRPGAEGGKPTGLQRIFDDRLAGHPAERLLFGKRVIARTKAAKGRDVHTTIRPALMARAANALGDRLGGVAVIRPRDGAVLALAGLAVSAPQPPGSTFKIITAAAALEDGKATPATTYPVRTAAVLSGTQLRNAGGESCGGTLTESFIESCNSVFAPLGAKVGAKKLVAAAERFGFNEEPRIPAAKPSTISPPSKLPDDLAVGAAAIGQDRDLATPLAMASVGATIATGGVRAAPRLSRLQKRVRKRAVSTKVAHQVREMMLGVVRSGTGTAAAIPGVEVAGKTGTAELRPNSSDPKDADAWFVAFAPAGRPEVAVAVMLVGAGFGGTAAAPVAREVLQAAL
ncbi:penicillin-binding transpeptidase domain-containing protein [Capillimicrobium parvum]|uniref:Peptidoglycan D,D-transpeptidase MrdA n=1 Tax=Capillimicrobium parvum TaxID=2884022 RepID=A0A9E6XZG0_9ACTN|nr:penicillin-binding transpeptidase domain-containing protein [Capillimicrobium parvum]UGS37135.1 Peptidoglycan D,D-transpeptidase MrdA [Capillimicrobium parvum]